VSGIGLGKAQATDCSPAKLSKEHRRMLEEESGISTEVVAGRGYYTAERRDELPGVFSGRQRRRGLVIPVLSPSGIMGYRLRPDKPINPKRKYEQPIGVPNALDVHPFNFERVRDVSADLWIVEGEKKADSLASRGECAIAITGVWNWCVPGTNGTELLPCWDHVALQGRNVYVAFDSDVLTNANIQLALTRLVVLLEDRVTRGVQVVYLPEVYGG